MVFITGNFVVPDKVIIEFYSDEVACDQLVFNKRHVSFHNTEEEGLYCSFFNNTHRVIVASIK